MKEQSKRRTINLFAQMALTQPRGFEGQVRGVSHHGQETHLHKQAGYIDADFLHPSTFPLHSDGGPYIRQLRRRASKLAGPVISSKSETYPPNPLTPLLY